VLVEDKVEEFSSQTWDIMLMRLLLSHRHSEQPALSEAEGTGRKPVLSEVEGRSD
jgi:hypothetical protein